MPFLTMVIPPVLHGIAMEQRKAMKTGDRANVRGDGIGRRWKEGGEFNL
jgi:hypothetical protein